MAATGQHSSADICSRDIDVTDETPSPEAADITTVSSGKTRFAVERALLKKDDISVQRNVDDRCEEVETVRETVRSATNDSDEAPNGTDASSSPQQASRGDGGGSSSVSRTPQRGAGVTELPASNV